MFILQIFIWAYPARKTWRSLMQSLTDRNFSTTWSSELNPNLWNSKRMKLSSKENVANGFHIQSRVFIHKRQLMKSFDIRSAGLWYTFWCGLSSKRPVVTKSWKVYISYPFDVRSSLSHAVALLYGIRLPAEEYFVLSQRTTFPDGQNFNQKTAPCIASHDRNPNQVCSVCYIFTL